MEVGKLGALGPGALQTFFFPPALSLTLQAAQLFLSVPRALWSGAHALPDPEPGRRGPGRGGVEGRGSRQIVPSSYAWAFSSPFPGSEKGKGTQKSPLLFAELWKGLLVKAASRSLITSKSEFSTLGTERNPHCAKGSAWGAALSGAITEVPGVSATAPPGTFWVSGAFLVGGGGRGDSGLCSL